MLIKLAVTFAVFCALLWVLNKAMPEFHIELGAIPVAALILVGINWLVGTLLGGAGGLLNILTLGIVKWILNLVTLGLFSLIISFVCNVIIFFIADKVTDRITIKSFKTLLISAAALQFTNYLIAKFV